MRDIKAPSVITAMCCCVFSVSASADWSGTLKITVQKGTQANYAGKIQSKGFKQRVDMTQPTPVTAIVDFQKKKAWNLMRSQKLAMEMRLDELRTSIPYCGEKDVAACLAKTGYKKTGTETLNGQKCDVYELESTFMNKKVHHKLWHAIKLSEVPAIRMLSEEADGAKVETSISDIRMTAINDSVFTIPKGYKVSSNMTDLIQGLKKE